jgi:4-hydroxy-2-oxoheptanedioate aldolase
MLSNAVKHKLEQGEVVKGAFTRHHAPQLAEWLTLSGWDFVLFDAEHGNLEPWQVEDLSRAVEVRGGTPFVRATTNSAPVILRYLDSGPVGIHVPWVNTAEEAEQVVQAVKYHPRGIRGLAGTRASDYGITEPLGAYIERANRETLVVVHIETVDAMERVDEIAAVDGVDVLFIGPTDLSHSLGLAGQLGHPTVVEAMDRIARRTLAAGKWLGLLAATPDRAAEWIDKGATYLCANVENVLAPGSSAYLAVGR